MRVSRWPTAKRLYTTIESGESDKLFLYQLNIQNAINPVTLQYTKPQVLITNLWVTTSSKARSSTGSGFIKVVLVLCIIHWGDILNVITSQLNS